VPMPDFIRIPTDKRVGSRCSGPAGFLKLAVSCLYLLSAVGACAWPHEAGTNSTIKFSTLVNFDGPNGDSPYAALVQGADGNFYGTTFNGGSAAQPYGTVFKVTPAGALTTLYDFSGTDGAAPFGALVQSADGNFYGTTQAGGTNNAGTVFKITPQGALTVLHSFETTENYDAPNGLVQGTDGNFYGTTSNTVFKVTPAGMLTTLHTFNGTDGQQSRAGLVQASDGNFYGTTEYGGSHGDGTVFKITPAGAFTSLHSFNRTDGESPFNDVLVQASDGNLYGTTFYGGANGYGTIFKITTGGTLTTLHSFIVTEGGGPNSLVQATDGNFYGTAAGEGLNDCPGGCGTIYKITPQGALTVLHSFDGTDGANPNAGLLQASDGNFYGTTTSEGTSGFPGDGTIFSLSVGTSTGTIEASTNLAEASFTITGPATYNGSGTSFSQANAPTGTYIITFDSVAGYDTPASQTKALAANSTIAFTGIYTAQLADGTMIIDANHPQATFSISPNLPGAPTRGPFPITIRNVPAGVYSVTFNPVPKGGYTVPPVSSQTVNGDSVTFDGIYQLIPGSMVDTDDDGLPDDWEVNGLPTSQGRVPLGGSPFHKDIYVYIDWLQKTFPPPVNGLLPQHSHQPDTSTLAPVIEAFKHAPILNPDNIAGVNVHITLGTGIEETPDLITLGTLDPQGDYSLAAFEHVKQTNGFNNELAAVYHYALFAHNIPNNFTGIAPVGGEDLIVSVWNYANHYAGFPIVYSTVVAGSFMHELGHNLTLTHGGWIPQGIRGSLIQDNTNYKPNYLSIMNYAFQTRGLIRRINGITFEGLLDYSEFALADLDKTIDASQHLNGLSETNGLNHGTYFGGATYGTRYFCSVEDNVGRTAPGDYNPWWPPSIDWNCDGAIEQQTVQANINKDSNPSGPTILRAPVADWSAISLKVGSIGSLQPGIPVDIPSTIPANELTFDEDRDIQPAVQLGCAGDVNHDGVVDTKDLNIIRDAFGTRVGDVGYNLAADLNNDGLINLYDLAIAGKNVGCSTH
jgi:uncharacterized repeat protein (TIGR03803 family)